MQRKLAEKYKHYQNEIQAGMIANLETDAEIVAMVFDWQKIYQLEGLEKALNSPLGASKLTYRQLDPKQSLKFLRAYSLLAGGKRLRPILTLAVWDLLNSKADKIATKADEPATENNCQPHKANSLWYSTNYKHEHILPVCLALEAVHTYSLIHDDLPCMDNDAYRHGLPTLHQIETEAKALLVGNDVFNWGFNLILQSELHNKAELAQILMTAASEMIRGQYQDLDLVQDNCDLAQLSQMINDKTGALLLAPFLLALSMVPAVDSLPSQALKEYAAHLGLSFQIQDDILDVEASFKDLGKTPGKDQNANKVTFVTLMGLDKAKERLEVELDQCMLCLKKLASLGYDTEFFVMLTEWLWQRQN